MGGGRRRDGELACGSGDVLTSVGGGESDGFPTPAVRATADRLNTVITWIAGAAGARSDAAQGRLAGLTVGVKDNIEVAGVPSTCASDFFREWVADSDAEVVDRLRAAGASIVATLNMAEFAVGVTSDNSAFGATRNPWDPDRVPGGSSGGSGAAVAAGVVDIALGTDTGGSIRLPAACCGVTGLRPTAGSISDAGVFPVCPEFDTVGPLARAAADVRQVTEVLMGRSLDLGIGDRPLRIAVPAEFVTSVDPAMTAAVGELAQFFSDAGHHLTTGAVPSVDSAQDVVYTLVYAELARIHGDRLRDEPGRFQQATRERIALGTEVSPEQERAATARRDDFRAGLADYFREVDVVLTPTMPIDVPATDRGGVVAQSRLMGKLTYPWSLHLGPTLALPVGVHPRSGMPIGAQLTAAPGREDVLFALAEMFQTRTGWHLRRPPVHVTGTV